jgi:hypothetical protein
MAPEAHQPSPPKTADTAPTPPEIDLDALHQLLGGEALRCLAALAAAGGPQPGATVAARGVWTVLLAVFPTPVATGPGLLELTPCDRDCLAFLAANAGQHVPARRVCEELDRQGRIHAEITVKRSLAKLNKRLGLIRNSKRSPKGYFLPDNSLFLRRAGS